MQLTVKAALPRHLISGELARGELVAKACSIPRERVPLYLAWHKHNQGLALSWFTQQLAAVNWQQVLSPTVR